MRPIRVAVADDDSVFRDALVDVLEADPRFAVVLTASSGTGFSHLVADVRPDLVVVDVRMHDGGAETVRSILEAGRSRPPAVVAVSAGSARHTVRSMVQAGVVGYLVKGRIGAVLPDLLSRIAAGEVVLAVPCAAEVLAELRGAAVTGRAAPRDGAA